MLHVAVEEGADGSWPVHSWGIQLRGKQGQTFVLRRALKGLVFHFATFFAAPPALRCRRQTENRLQYAASRTQLARAATSEMGQEPTILHLQFSEAYDRSTHPHRVPAIGHNRLPGYAFHSAIADNHLGDIISVPSSSKH